jgi:hypothetical protein
LFTSTVLWVVFAVLIRHWRLPSIPAIAGVPLLSLVAIVPGFLGWYGSEYLRARPLVPMAFPGAGPRITAGCSGDQRIPMDRDLEKPWH